MNMLVQVLELYVIVVIVRVILSWVRPYPGSEIERMIYQVTEPALAPLRRILPVMGGFDLSPLVLILIVQFVINFLRRGAAHGGW